MERWAPGWEQRLEAGDAARLLEERELRVAPWVLRPFVESYRVIADTLVGYEGELEDKVVLRAAVARGRQYVAQGRLRSPESLASTLLGSALRLASNRELLEVESDDERKAFATSIEATIAALDDIAALD